MQKIGILITSMGRMSVYVQHPFYGSGNYDVYAGLDGEEPEKMGENVRGERVKDVIQDIDSDIEFIGKHDGFGLNKCKMIYEYNSESGKFE